MWADTLQRAESIYLLRICFWGGLATIVGTALLIIGMAQRRSSGLVFWFAAVCVVLGSAELVFAAIAYRAVPLRDLSGATRLDRIAWLQLGLYIGLTAVGATLLSATYFGGAPCVRARSRTLSGVGAGAATILHGIALATLQLLLIEQISR